MQILTNDTQELTLYKFEIKPDIQTESEKILSMTRRRHISQLCHAAGHQLIKTFNPLLG
jgi:hypothetical protein